MQYSEANHNKDYSVVKTFKAGKKFLAFFSIISPNALYAAMCAEPKTYIYYSQARKLRRTEVASDVVAQSQKTGLFLQVSHY